MNQIITAIIALIGVIAGVSLQRKFSKASTSEEHEQKMKTQSYCDFLKAIAGIAAAQNHSDEKQEKEFKTLIIEAKAKICIYGDSEVISSMAIFWRTGASLGSDEGKKAFLDMVKIMRRKSGIKEPCVKDEDVSQLLMGIDLKEK